MNLSQKGANPNMGRARVNTLPKQRNLPKAMRRRMMNQLQTGMNWNVKPRKVILVVNC